MKAQAFVNKLLDIANNYKTLYVMGCFGAPLTVKNKQRYTKDYAYNKQEPTLSKILHASEDTFGFDCVCLIKGVLWGWCGDINATYGGAVYASNGVQDMSTESMINFCHGVSTNFDKIEVGELMWMQGHVGIYIGDRLVVECSPAWEGDVQITGIKGNTKTSRIRTWKKHGKLPWIDYGEVRPMFTEKQIWDFLHNAIGNDYGVAGLMGNLQAESCLSPINLENSKEPKLNYTDESYTRAVDDGTYKNFVGDAAGYGYAQWTSSGRKQNLYSYHLQCGTSIGDSNMQLEYLIKELQGSYSQVWKALVSATNVRDASDIVLTKFEIPANQDINVKRYRASLGQAFYNKYAITQKPLYKVIVTVDVLNVRSGAGTDYDIVTGIGKGTIKDVYAEQERQGMKWGKIDIGWIALQYTVKV